MSEKTVLIVDDEGYVRNAMTAAFKQAGFDVLEAGSLRVAQFAVRDGASSLAAAIVDLNLHRMSGRPLLEELRDRGVPVVVISGGPTEDVRDLLDAPDWPVKFVPKPFAATDLVTVVKALLAAA